MVYFMVSYKLSYIFGSLCFLLSDATETSERRRYMLLVTLLSGPVSNQSHPSLASATLLPCGGSKWVQRPGWLWRAAAAALRVGCRRPISVCVGARTRAGCRRRRAGAPGGALGPPPPRCCRCSAPPGRPRGASSAHTGRGSGQAEGICAESSSPRFGLGMRFRPSLLGEATDTQVLPTGKQLEL